MKFRARTVKSGVFRVRSETLVQKAFIRTLRYIRFLINQRQNSSAFRLQKFKGWLLVERWSTSNEREYSDSQGEQYWYLIIFKSYGFDGNTFGCILCLFHTEDMVVKMELQLFVAVVDAQLLERIRFKAFKPKDIKNRNKLAIVALATE